MSETEKIVNISPEELQIIEEVVKIARELPNVFTPSKKPGVLLHKLFHLLHRLPPQVRERLLNQILLQGQVNVKGLRFLHYTIDWKALQEALKRELKHVNNPVEKMALEEFINKLSTLPTSFQSLEELRENIQQLASNIEISKLNKEEFIRELRDMLKRAHLPEPIVEEIVRGVEEELGNELYGPAVENVSQLVQNVVNKVKEKYVIVNLGELFNRISDIISPLGPEGPALADQLFREVVEKFFHRSGMYMGEVAVPRQVLEEALSYVAEKISQILSRHGIKYSSQYIKEALLNREKLINVIKNVEAHRKYYVSIMNNMVNSKVQIYVPPTTNVEVSPNFIKALKEAIKLINQYSGKWNWEETVVSILRPVFEEYGVNARIEVTTLYENRQIPGAKAIVIEFPNGGKIILYTYYPTKSDIARALETLLQNTLPLGASIILSEVASRPLYREVNIKLNIKPPVEKVRPFNRKLLDRVVSLVMQYVLPVYEMVTYRYRFYLPSMFYGGD